MSSGKEREGDKSAKECVVKGKQSRCSDSEVDRGWRLGTNRRREAVGPRQ